MTDRRHPMVLKITQTDGTKMVWNFGDSKKLDSLFEAYRENLLDWVKMEVIITNPEMEPQYSTWSARLNPNPNLKDEYPPESYYQVMLPNGFWFEVIASNEEDAIETAMASWDRTESLCGRKQ